MVRPPRTDRRRTYRRLAIALWLAPLVVGFPLWWEALRDPSLLIRYWDVWLLFFAIPFAIAFVLWIKASKPPY